MIPVNRETAMMDPCCHVFRHGQGYLHVGEPALPAKPVHPPAKAEPPAATADGSWHVLVPQQGGPGVSMRWNAARRCWMPVIGTGIRTAFSPQYLAAHGWTYKGPKPAPASKPAG
jgi:hypothetical protein